MATRLGEIPDKTRELVELQRYLKASMTETMPVTNTIYVHLYIKINSRHFNEMNLQKLLFLFTGTYVQNWHSDPKSSFSIRLYASSSRRYSAEHSSVSMA